MPACLVQVDAALLWNGVDHFDLVNVVSSQLSCLGGVLKAQIHYALLDSMLVVSLHLKAEQVHNSADALRSGEIHACLKLFEGTRCLHDVRPHQRN